MPDCPGRYILAGGVSRIPPGDLVRNAPVREYQVSTAPDPVFVVRFDGGGVISYKKANGSYLHTLNTSEGFERKLQQLGISLPD